MRSPVDLVTNSASNWHTIFGDPFSRLLIQRASSNGYRIDSHLERDTAYGSLTGTVNFIDVNNLNTALFGLRLDSDRDLSLYFFHYGSNRAGGLLTRAAFLSTVGRIELQFGSLTLVYDSLSALSTQQDDFTVVTLRSANNSILQTIRDSIVNNSSTPLQISISSAPKARFSEAREVVEPAIFSAVYKVNKELTDTEDIKNVITVAEQSTAATRSNFYLTPQSVRQGPTVGTDVFYYKRTEDNPLDINPLVFPFTIENPSINMLIQYILEANVAFSAAQLLKAKVYKYKCRFKWVDQLGIEHRSQFSDEVSLFSNSDIGGENNQPTFNLNNLHLTNKSSDNLSIEVYRTENLLSEFKLLKEIKNDQAVNKSVITDDILDADLGQLADPVSILISGRSVFNTV